MTNRELAAKLGISPATLSLVINNKPGISVAMRTKVLEQLEAMGLSHLVKTGGNSANHAKALENICFVAYKRHGNILDQSPFFLLLMESIEHCAHKNGFNLLFLSIDRRNDIEAQYARFAEMDCRGAVIFATEMLDDDLKYFTELPFPCVFLDNDSMTAEFDSVAINNTAGTYQAIEHLVQMGHTEIGYLKSRIFINSFAERERGYQEALSHFGLSLQSNYIFGLDYSEDGSYYEFKNLLSKGVKLPTAFVTDVDTIAVGAMKAMQETGLSIPDDVSVVGFDDRPICSLVSPQLTTIRVPKYAFGAMAIALLVTRINDMDIKKDDIGSIKYRVGTRLVERNSVRRL